MYDELVKSLREMSKMGMKYGMTVVTMREAADAIDELNKIREEQKAQIILMAAEDKPRWIPVTERLPEEDGCYLVAVKNDHKRRYSKTAWFSHDSWLARQGVTHWMPLPQPPKEGNE